MLQKATFGAGCFWGVEARFRALNGVVEAFSGYEGGLTDNPTYEDVCTDLTGHAEVVEVEFDPGLISYEALLNEFFDLHDPTTPNRQGPDVGSQYRSVIFYHSDEQRDLAREKIAELEKQNRFPKPIVTEVVAAQTFYKAEDYHQKYYEKRGLKGCGI